MSFQGYAIVLAEGGSELHFDGEVFDLGEGKPRFVITPEGAIRKAAASSAGPT